MIKSLILKRKTTNQAIDSLIETVLPDIPFYGLKGTICRIEVLKDDYDNRELCYYKVLYNQDGTISKDKVRVPKSKGKNLSSLINDYYNDLKKYLDLNNSKYLDYKENGLKEKNNKKTIQALIILSVIAIVIFIPILLSTTYIGAIIEAICLLLFYKANELHKKIIEDEKKSEFIKQYDYYQKDLVKYQSLKNDKDNKLKKYNQTKISSKSNKLEQEFKKNKIKTLIKEELREAI